jgi:hypothetical protein
VTKEARGQNARVIQDEEIAGSQQLGKLVKDVRTESACRSINQQEPSMIALGTRFLGYQLGRQIVIVEDVGHKPRP